MSDLGKLITFCAITIIGLILAWILFSYIEAISYKELTGIEVTTRQAMFIQLRLTPCN